jgi:cardiolipin synthase
MPRALRSQTIETREGRAPVQALAGRGGAELFTIPNGLTALRILLVPVFLSYYFANEVRTAALVFAVAASSDVLDGLLARLLKQRTAIGAILDPLADKLLGLASLVALVVHHRLPVWLLALSLLRDAVVVTVAVVAASRGLSIAPTPTRIGKYATFFANGAVILALIWEISYAPWLAGYVLATAIVASECLVVAATQYALRFAALARVR